MEDTTGVPTAIPHKHKVVRLYHPGRDVRVEYVQSPKIEAPGDVIVKVQLAGLCGSDMHTYRGHQIPEEPFVMGHEFIGEVVVLGSDFSSGILKRGDFVVSPFTSSCGKCRACRVGFTCRCAESLLFGYSKLPGGQAQYVRVPNAAGTLFKIPLDNATDDTSLGIKWKPMAPECLLLLADILPTGCFAALQALQHPNLLPYLRGLPYPLSTPLSGSADPALDGKNATAAQLLTQQERRLVFAVVGLGPVGICSLIALVHLLHKHECKDFRIVAIDLLETRRDKIRKIAEAIDLKGGLVQTASPEEAKLVVQEWTDSLGCNAVLEVVGYSPAMELSYELVQPFGVISSVGVHQTEKLPFTGADCYNKNVSFCFGRCPVRSMFPLALEILLERQDIFSGVGTETSLVERVVGMDQDTVSQSYEDFDKGRCGKVLFDPWK